MEISHLSGNQQMILGKQQLMKVVAEWLPSGLLPLAKRMKTRGRHWAHPTLKKFGTIQDLYYWTADGNLDTLLLLQNYFSAFYPMLDTETEGSISIYDRAGAFLGKRVFSVPHLGGAKFRVSAILKDLAAPPDDTFGTLEVNIAIPEGVLEHIGDQKSLYFWDRFYIGYTSALGQTCFVHGIDKTHIYRTGVSEPAYWYETSNDHEWAPEAPVNIDDYKTFTVIMINRSPRSKTVTLILSDTGDSSLTWSADVPSGGVHRFVLNGDHTSGLIPTEMRMRVKGMATQYGRPMIFKEFRNGAISAMHG